MDFIYVQKYLFIQLVHKSAVIVWSDSFLRLSARYIFYINLVLLSHWTAIDLSSFNLNLPVSTICPVYATISSEHQVPWKAKPRLRLREFSSKLCLKKVGSSWGWSRNSVPWFKSKNISLSVLILFCAFFGGHLQSLESPSQCFLLVNCCLSRIPPLLKISCHDDPLCVFSGICD